MIDPTVAYDKLAQFETSQEVADFLGECGIKGKKSSAFSCAISAYMSMMTGNKYGTACDIEEWDSNDPVPVKIFPLTLALDDFVTNFDRGHYPELEIP